jgi:hypothetical protein
MFNLSITDHQPDDKEQSQMELLKQLHEQYAINNNANLSSIVTLVAAMIVVVGYFFYVYVHSTLKFSGDCNLLYTNGKYSLDALLIIFVGTIFVIEALSCLCVYQGIAQRKEQFITYAIRVKTFGENFLNESDIFPKGYHPFGKNVKEAIQGLYGELYTLFSFTKRFLIILVIIKLAAHVYYFSQWPSPDWDLVGILSVLFSFFAIFLILGYGCSYTQKQYHSYCLREKEYEKMASIEIKEEANKQSFICKILMIFEKK